MSELCATKPSLGSQHGAVFILAKDKQKYFDINQEIAET